MLFPKTSKMAQYTEQSGYAIPLYKPVAREVTAATRAAHDPATMKAKATDSFKNDSVETDLIAYVVEGTLANLKAARATRISGVRTEIRKRTDTHTTKVKTAYDKNKNLIPKQQEAGADAAAKAYMGKIVAQVNNSLARARLETERLF